MMPRPQPQAVRRVSTTPVPSSSPTRLHLSAHTHRQRSPEVSKRLLAHLAVRIVEFHLVLLLCLLDGLDDALCDLRWTGAGRDGLWEGEGSRGRDVVCGELHVALLKEVDVNLDPPRKGSGRRREVQSVG